MSNRKDRWALEMAKRTGADQYAYSAWVSSTMAYGMRSCRTCPAPFVWNAIPGLFDAFRACELHMHEIERVYVSGRMREF